MEIAIPIWAQQITVFMVMLASGILGIYKYFKTETEKIVPKQVESPVVEVTSDTRVLKELIDTLREHQDELGRQAQRVSRAQMDLREVLIELNESVQLNSSSMTNLLRFIKTKEL